MLQARQDVQPIHLQGFAKNVREVIDGFETLMLGDLLLIQRTQAEAEVRDLRTLLLQVERDLTQVPESDSRGGWLT